MFIKPATETEMLEQGFPKELQTAFKRTAEATQCVILSRVPGGATTALIEAGHDLKGYFIKAKSCDWGPMSGFVCQVPAFNKKGVDGIEHNAEKNLDYYKEFLDRLHSPQEDLDETKGPSDAKERIKSIFEKNKLKWQEQWDGLLLGEQGDPIKKTRAFLKGKSDQEAVSGLSGQVNQDKKVFTDDGTSPNNKTNSKFSERLNTVVHDLRTLVGDDSPFVPLGLAPKVFAAFKTSTDKYIASIDDIITCGIAHKKSDTGTIVFKYIVKKNKEVYDLYHGHIVVFVDGHAWLLELYFKATFDKADDRQCGILGISASDGQPGETISEICGDLEVERVSTALVKQCESFTNDNPNVLPPYEQSNEKIRNELFYPIKGIQNYYPPFSGEDAYKNAVTGDYDLFACWPRISHADIEDLVRWSEREAEPKAEDGLFSRMPSKQFSLRSTVSRNVIVEFTPSLKFQHSSFGNINALISLVAGTLNSFVNVGLAKGARNVAFHSDEGGRPEIYEVEYPAAAFVPKALMAVGSIATDLIGEGADKKNEQMFIITNHVELLTMINAVKNECYVPLNFAWVYDFLKSEEDNVKKSLKAVFCSGSEENQTGQLSSLKKKFTSLFSNRDKEDSAFFADPSAKIKYVMDPNPDAQAPKGAKKH